MASKAYLLAQECMRQSESCLYTSTSLYIYLRILRISRFLFIVLPIICGSIVGWDFMVNGDSGVKMGILAICTLFTSLVPSVYTALKVEDHILLAAQQAATFKNLQDGFRVCGIIQSRGAFINFEAAFYKIMQRMEEARAPSFTAPELCFQLARLKIRTGHYDFSVDLPNDFTEETDASNSQSMTK